MQSRCFKWLVSITTTLFSRIRLDFRVRHTEYQPCQAFIILTDTPWSQEPGARALSSMAVPRRYLDNPPGARIECRSSRGASSGIPSWLPCLQPADGETGQTGLWLSEKEAKSLVTFLAPFVIRLCYGAGLPQSMSGIGDRQGGKRKVTYLT